MSSDPVLPGETAIPMLYLWSGLGAIASPSASPDEVRLEGDLWALYELFLVQGTPELKTSALSLIRHYLKTHQPLALKLVSGRALLRFTADLNQLSLGYVIDLLVSMDLHPAPTG